MVEDKFLDNLKKDLKKDFKKLDSNEKMMGEIKRDLNLTEEKKHAKRSMKKIKIPSPKKIRPVKKKAKYSRNVKPKPKKLEYNLKDVPSLQIKDERDIAMDFATKVYQRFNKIIKSIVLFGSTAKETTTNGSDIDIMVLIDDATINWDQELIAWYRTELEKIMQTNPYKQNLHINTIKLTTWWEDMIRGDPVVMNIIRDGESLIDFGGFFEPLKFLLMSGKIKATPEAVHSLLQRAPMHLLRSKASEMGAIDGLFWAMVDSAQAALISVGVQPPSPEHIPMELNDAFVKSGKLKMKYVVWYSDLFSLHKKIIHREVNDLKGVEIDAWQERTREFIQVMAKLVNDAISS